MTPLRLINQEYANAKRGTTERRENVYNANRLLIKTQLVTQHVRPVRRATLPLDAKRKHVTATDADP